MNKRIKFNSKDELKFYVSYTENYSEKEYKLANYIERKAFKDHLFIENKLSNRNIPFIDCDDKKSKDLAEKYLISKELSYNIFLSSKDRFWLFPAITFGTFGKCINFIEKVPGICSNYVKCSKRDGISIIRGNLKNYKESPKILTKNSSNLIVNAYCELLEQFFSNLNYESLSDKIFKAFHY